MMWWGSGYGWIWTLLMVLTWVAVVGLAVWAATALGGRGGRGESGRSSARRILDERFARGEIDEEEYRQRRDALER